MFPSFLYIADSLQHNPHMCKGKYCCVTSVGLKFVPINKIKCYKFYVDIISYYLITDFNQSNLQI